jgi:PPOX class probable F420-dependent enzyme
MRLLGQKLDATTLDRLRTETVLWLGTTGPDGAPHLVPVWFVWDGQAFLVFSKPNAVKVRHIAGEPRVAIALGEAEDDFDVQLVDARAELLDRPTADVVPDDLFDKYRSQLAAIGLSREEYVATYSQAIRIAPTRFLPWRGRSWLDGRRAAALPAAGVPSPLPAWA